MNFLLVDDEKVILRDMSRMLKETLTEKVNILCADYWKDSLEFVKNNEIQAAFLDIEMPEMNGLQLAKRIKELQPNVNIIFVTAYSEYMKDAWDMYVSGYLLKPVQKDAIKKAIEHFRYPVQEKKDKLRIQCFGNFECFAGGDPIQFERTKSKEFFAYLIDRRGAKISTGELRSILWEEAQDSISKRSYIRTLASDIRKTFLAKGYPDILKHERDCYYINSTEINCDYYRYLRGDVTAVNQYRGEYMRQYSWAEMTVPSLSQ